MTPAPDLLWDGDAGASTTVLLAHGAGAGRSSEFLTDVAQGLAAHGLRVARFDFPYMARRHDGERRPPDPEPRLLASFRAAAAATGVAPSGLVLAGKSLGGRMATLLADELGVASVVVFGYPFHPPGRPARLRTAHLATMRTPCLLLQGERDPFGTRAEVVDYDLSPAVTMHWLPDGDHSLVPRKQSGVSASQNLAAAIAAAVAFAALVRGQQAGHVVP